MTEVQKKQITELRRKGCSYADIADTVKMPQGTVKSFCWRNRISHTDVSDKPKLIKVGCLNCGCALVQKGDAPPRKFCSEKCRSDW